MLPSVVSAFYNYIDACLENLSPEQLPKAMQLYLLMNKLYNKQNIFEKRQSLETPLAALMQFCRNNFQFEEDILIPNTTIIFEQMLSENPQTVSEELNIFRELMEKLQQKLKKAYSITAESLNNKLQQLLALFTDKESLPNRKEQNSQLNHFCQLIEIASQPDSPARNQNFRQLLSQAPGKNYASLVKNLDPSSFSILLQFSFSDEQVNSVKQKILAIQTLQQQRTQNTATQNISSTSVAWEKEQKQQPAHSNTNDDTTKNPTLPSRPSSH
jgi:hypothetical protein